jgi:hypothetical protein
MSLEDKGMRKSVKGPSKIFSSRIEMSRVVCVVEEKLDWTMERQLVQRKNLKHVGKLSMFQFSLIHFLLATVVRGSKKTIRAPPS